MAPSVGLNRQQIIEAAARLADQHGLDQLTLNQVAQAVGVRLPSLYNHVEGLKGLQRELALLGLRELLGVLTRAALGKAGDEAVLALALAYRHYALAHPGRYDATVRAPRADDHELQALSRSIIEVLQTVLEPYHLEPEETIHAIRALRSIVHGFTTLERVGGFGLPIAPEISFVRLISMYCAGLRA